MTASCSPSSTSTGTRSPPRRCLPGYATPELLALFTGYGYRPVLVEGGFDGESPMDVHQRMAAALDEVFAQIRDIQESARLHAVADRPAWPMLILRTPKGWTGPKVVDGLPVEGTFRAHQVPLAEVRTNPEHLAQLEGMAPQLPARGTL